MSFKTALLFRALTTTVIVILNIKLQKKSDTP